MDGRDGGLALARRWSRAPRAEDAGGRPGAVGKGVPATFGGAHLPACLPAPGASGCNWAPPRVHGGSTRCPRSRLTGEAAIRGAGGPDLPPAGEPGGTQGDRAARGTESARPRRPPVTTTTAARATRAADSASRAPRRCVARLDGAGPKAAGATDSRSPVPSALVHPEAPLRDAKWEPWGA